LSGFLALTEISSWNDVEVTVNYLRENGMHVDDSKCFDQLCNLKKFVEANCKDDDFNELAHERIARTMNAPQNFLSSQNFSLRFRHITLTLNECFHLCKASGQRNETSCMLNP